MATLSNIQAFPRGAQFYRADLHIHSFGASHDVKDTTMTPRAIVQQAIDEGLGLIAITDHNEVRNVQAAVDAAAGGPVVVVPGVELSTPEGHLLCYTETVEQINRFHGRLNFAGAGTQESRCQTAMLDCLNQLREQGGFAILAHVDAGGGLEQARPGNSPHKTDILCHPTLLGVEVQKATSDISWSGDDPNADRVNVAKQRIERLHLGEKQYLARLLNSDAHSLAALGRNAENAKRVTRVKMDAPSFKALRLALEDGDARVRLEDQIPPTVPMIVGMHFDGGFLNDQTLHFSPNLNCIIGGRGTGKSTTFEAVRCLAQSPSEADVVDSEVWPNALYLFWVDLFGVRHALYRGHGEAVQNLDDEIDGPTTFEIDCFGQGDTARISDAAKKDPLALLQYLDRFTKVREALCDEERAIEELRQSQAAVAAVSKQVADIPQYQRALDLTRKQLEALEKANATGLIELQRKVEEERALRTQVISNVKTLGRTFAPTMHPAAATIKASAPASDLTLGEAEYAAILSEVISFESMVTSALAAPKAQWPAVAAKVEEQLSQWKGKETEILAQIEARRKALEQQGVRLDMAAIRKVTQDEASHKRTLQDLEAKKATLVGLQHEHSKARARRWAARDRVATVRTAYAVAANKVLGAELDDLKVTLKFAVSAYSPTADDLIIQVMAWRTNQQPRAALLTQGLTVKTLLECIDSKTTAPLEGLDNAAGIKQFSRAEAEDILNRLSEQKVRDQLETAAIHDRPKLSVTKKIEENGQTRHVSRDFARLSLGQQQSVLLALMLSADTTAPLIIDQPEDNLDGEFIYHTLVPVLRRAKERRQVIVVTHNANIAVLGDAELLFILKSGNDKAQIVARGAIDEQATRKEACKILEGAKEAFQRRAKTYGFKIEAD